MKGIGFTLIWLLILLAACYDGYFAWEYQYHFENWEMNPVARWVAGSFGFHAMLFAKGIGVTFAAIVALSCYFRRNRLGIPLTVIASCCYLFLSIYYAVGFSLGPTPTDEAVLASRIP